MKTIWFTADTHFGHANIIKHSYRPFKDVEEMDARIINQWNGLVVPGDDVYHLGDFAFTHKKAEVNRYIDRLNGNIHLIAGNHDHKNTRKASFASVDYYKRLIIDDKVLILSHYPMVTWDMSHYGSIMVHGHCHGNLNINDNAKRYDVGIDCNSFSPVPFEIIKARTHVLGIAKYDHHGEG